MDEASPKTFPWPFHGRGLKVCPATFIHAEKRLADHGGGPGHLYQGRFKAFPIEADEHLYAVLRYVERNPLRANLVRKVQEWRFSSLWHRLHGQEPSILHPWPVPMPENWLDLVRQPQTEAELEALRRSIARGSPFGSEAWSKRTVRRLGLESTIRPRGRPRKGEK